MKNGLDGSKVLFLLLNLFHGLMPRISFSDVAGGVGVLFVFIVFLLEIWSCFHGVSVGVGCLGLMAACFLAMIGVCYFGCVMLSPLDTGDIDRVLGEYKSCGESSFYKSLAGGCANSEIFRRKGGDVLLGMERFNGFVLALSYGEFMELKYFVCLGVFLCRGSASRICFDAVDFLMNEASKGGVPGSLIKDLGKSPLSVLSLLKSKEGDFGFRKGSSIDSLMVAVRVLSCVGAVSSAFFWMVSHYAGFMVFSWVWWVALVTWSTVIGFIWFFLFCGCEWWLDSVKDTINKSKKAVECQ